MPKPSSASGSGGDRPRALMLAPECPYPTVGGGPLRTGSVLEYLRLHYEVDVITFREPGAPDPSVLFPEGMGVHVIDLPFHSKSPASRATRNLGRFLRGVPPLMDRFGGFGAQVSAAIASRRYRLGVIEHFWCAGYGQALRNFCDRLVLNLHNVESVLMARCAKAESGVARLFFRRWAERSRILEEALLPGFETVLVPSESDAAKLTVRSLVLPNTIPWTPLPEVKKRHEVVFSGNLEYQPNQTGVTWFRQKIWPDLRSRCPGLVWRLTGKNEHAVKGLLDDDPRIVLTGPVDDAVHSIAQSAVAVVPLLSGSGTRIKIIEAWAAGVPVVSTTIGAEGLGGTPDRDLLIADTPPEFIRAVVRLLENSLFSCDIQVNGRRQYEKNLTWEAAWSILNRAGL